MILDHREAPGRPTHERSRLVTIFAAVAVDGALHTTGLPAGFAGILHVALCAVPLLTLLVRRLDPQHWGNDRGGGVVFVGMPGKCHAHSLERKSVTRHSYRD